MKNVYNLKSARAALQGMAEGYLLGKGTVNNRKITHLIEQWSLTTDENDPTLGFITAKILCFGLPGNHTAQPSDNKFTLSLLLVDNKTQLDIPLEVGHLFEKSGEGNLELSLVIHYDEPIPDAVIRIVGDDGSNQKESGRKDGTFRFSLNRGVRYVMMAGCRGYLNGKQEFMSDTAEVDAEYVVDFVLASVTKPVILENIFYDFDKATLRPESEEALDRELITILNDNPNISIELASHTDFRGRDAYNEELSQRRAQSVVDYLIQQGIAPDRVKAVGYGESVPKVITKKLATLYPQFKEGDILTEEFILTLSEEDQEIAHQINRRTEFQVLSITYGFY